MEEEGTSSWACSQFLSRAEGRRPYLSSQGSQGPNKCAPLPVEASIASVSLFELHQDDNKRKPCVLDDFKTLPGKEEMSDHTRERKLRLRKKSRNRRVELTGPASRRLSAHPRAENKKGEREKVGITRTQRK